MSSFPLVSVVLPMYNAEKYVGQAIQSILDQSFKKWELIVVDDGSTDRSLPVAESFRDPRVTIMRHPRNLGYPAAMNTGIGHAKGKFIARMDADDVSVVNRLERQHAFLEEHPEMAFVGTWRYWIGAKASIYPEIDTDAAATWIQENWSTVMDGSRKFVDASVLVPHKYVKEVGGYRTYQRSGQDVDLWLRILEKHPMAGTLPEYLYGRRLLPSAITFSEGTHIKNRIPRILARERADTGTDRVMRGEPLDDRVSAQDARAARAWRLTMLWNSARVFYKAREFSYANSFARAAIRAGGWHPRFAPLWGRCLWAVFSH